MENKKIATASRWEVRSEFQRLMNRFGLKRKSGVISDYFTHRPFMAEGEKGDSLWKRVRLIMTGHDLTLRVFCDDEEEKERLVKELRSQLRNYPHRELGKDGRGLGYIWIDSWKNAISIGMVVHPTADGRIPVLRLRVYADLMQSLILRNFSKEVWHAEYMPEEVINY